MDGNHLAHAQGDAINAVLAAAGYNFRLLLTCLTLLLRLMLVMHFGAIRPLHALKLNCSQATICGRDSPHLTGEEKMWGMMTLAA